MIHGCYFDDDDKTRYFFSSDLLSVFLHVTNTDGRPSFDCIYIYTIALST
jgi:hypothetical protein